MPKTRGAGARILGGVLKGRRLEVPAGARPSEGRVREALASIWQARLPGARVLDLFAGSGAVGLDALSRGAAQAVLVEGDPAALRALERNCKIAAELGPGRALVRRAALPGGLAVALADQPGFDLVFADPPYRFTAYAALLRAVAPHLAPGGEAAIEHAARVELPAEAGGLRRREVRRWGESAVSFYGYDLSGATA